MQNPPAPVEETAPATPATESSAAEESQPATAVPEAPAAAEERVAEPATGGEGEEN
jgi:hypothetical protein